MIGTNNSLNTINVHILMTKQMLRSCQYKIIAGKSRVIFLNIIGIYIYIRLPRSQVVSSITKICNLRKYILS